MERKKTILIFGISSFLGSNLAEKLKDKYKVVGTYYKTQVNIPGILSVKCDVHNKNMVQKVTYIFKPDITIYAVGLSDLKACQEFPKVADALNTAGVFNVSQASERYNSKFIYFSSPYVFSGENLLFKENDTPMPLSVYGNTIASAEFYIQKSCLNYIIFRCAPFFGRTYNPNDLSWSEVIEKCNFLSQKITCDNKVFTGYLDFETVAEILDMSIQQGVTNRLFQLSSSDICSRYEFAKKYLDVFEGNTSLATKSDWSFPRSENQINLQNVGEELYFAMDLSNVEETFEIKLPTIEESLKRYRKSLKGAIGGTKIKNSEITFI